MKAGRLVEQLGKVGISTGLVIGMAGQPTLAQISIEEIVVTATKRETTIQETSTAISAFSGEQLAYRGLDTAQDLAFSVPGLVYGEAIGSPQITIRGVGLSVETGAAEMGVATYLNGVFLSRPGLTNLNFGDMERVEVLRGPQGTLYGRNATGGAINFITKKPTEKFEGTAAIGGGSFGGFMGEAAVSGPIASDRLMARLYARYEHTDGFVDDLSPVGGSDTLGEADSVSVRLSLLARPSEKLKINLTGAYFEKDGNFSFEQVTNFAGIPNPLNPEPIFTTEPNKVLHNSPGDTFFDAYLGSLTVSWDAGPVQIKSITGYTEHTRDEILDADARLPSPILLPFPPFFDFDFAVDRADEYETFTQEINLTGEAWGRLQWLVGGFFMREDVGLRIHTQFGPSTPLAGLPLIGSNTEEENTSMAVFADLTLSLTDDLRLLAGARLGRDEKEVTQRDEGIAPTALGYNADGTCDLNPDLEFDDFSPKAGVEYDVSDTTLVYATFQQAIKPGGYNLTVCGDQFGEENLTSYEAGFKTTLLDGRLVINGTGFYYDYKDYQVFQLVPPATAEILNAPEAHVTGAELEVFGVLSDNFSFDLGFSYLDAVYDEFSGADPIFKLGIPPVQDLSGNRLTRAPEFSINAGLEFMLPLEQINLGNLRVRGEIFHVDDMYFRQFNTEFDRQDAYTVANIIVSVTSRDDRFQVRGFVKNVTDSEYIVSQLSNALEGFAVAPGPDGLSATFLGIYGAPRTFGVELSAKF